MISAKAKAAMESGDLALAQELYCDYLTTLDQGPHSIETKIDEFWLERNDEFWLHILYIL